MTDIPNTRYITINAKGIFVGGAPAKKYNGQEIHSIERVRSLFQQIQKQNPNFTEINIMASETCGLLSGCQISGNLPSSIVGKYAWCRVVLKDGSVEPWIFFYSLGSAKSCAITCAYHCMTDILYNDSLRASLLREMPKTTIQTPISPVAVVANNESQIQR